MPNFLRLIVIFITLFYWALMIPILELYSNVLDCSAFDPFFIPSQCNDPITKIISIPALIITAFSAFLYLWANRSYNFLQPNFLRIKFHTIELIITSLNIILIVFFSSIEASIPILIDLLIIIIGLLWLYNVVYGSEFSNQTVHTIFLAFLIGFLITSIAFLLKDSTPILNQTNFFYTLMMGLAFSIKMSMKILEKTNTHRFDSSFQDFSYLAVSLDNFYSLFEEKHLHEKSAFFFNGLFRNHFLTCKTTNCLITQQRFSNFFINNTLEQSRTISSFVAEVLIRTLKNKDIMKSVDFERLLLRYGSFVTHKSMNAIKAIYELEHVLNLNKSPSLYFTCVSKSLHKNLQSRILEYERIAKSNDTETEKKEIDVATFSYNNKTKGKFQRSFINLLKIRQDFFEKLRDGYPGYDELMNSACLLNEKIYEMMTFLDFKIKSSKQNLLQLMLPLKFRSILSCMVLNHLNEGFKAEEELEKLRKREISLNKNILNSLSFFDENVLFIQASFLGSDGIILDSSKTEKLAKFFNYTLEESKSIKKISQFMPKLIKGFHQKLVDWYINKPRHANSIEKLNFETYAAMKNGALFPIKIYVGPCFEYKDDFVFQTALIKSKTEFQGFIFDKNGDFQGFSQQFMNSLGLELSHESNEDLCLLNAFVLMPNLKEILEKNQAFHDISLTRLRNITSIFYLPNNMVEIMEILKTKAKEEETMKSHKSSQRSIKSSNSAKSVKSNNPQKKTITNQSSSKNNSKFISKFFKTTNLSNDHRSLIQKRYLENTLTNYEIFNQLMDRHNSRKIKLNFDLFFHHHQISSTDSIQFASFIVQKMAFIIHNDNPLSHSNRDLTMDELNSGGDPTIIQASEIHTGFINMPPPNVFEFRDSPKPSIEKMYENAIFMTEGNRLFTTEGDQNNENLLEKKLKDDLIIGNASRKRENEEKKIENEGLIVKTNNNDAEKFMKAPMISLNENEISSNQEKNKDEENSIESGFKSSDSKEKRLELNKDEEKGKAKTSNEKILDINDISSQNTSMSSLKKTFTIFNMMKLIQKHIPNVLYIIFFTRLIEVLVIIIYCIILMVLSREYIYSYYEPLEIAVVNFANIYNGLSLISSIMIEVEMIRNNYTTLSENSTYFELFRTHLNEEFIQFKSIVESEREKPNLHGYQNFYKSSYVNITDLIQPKFEIVPNLQFFDTLTEMTDEIKDLDNDRLDTMECDYLINNFLVYQDEFDTLTAMIWHEFDTTNTMIVSSVEDSLIIFVLFIFVMKFVDFYKLDQYYKQLTQIFNILLRTNQNESITEIITTNQMIITLSDQFDKFLHMNFAEELFNRKTVKMVDNDINLNMSRNKNLEKEAKLQLKKAKKAKSTRRSSMNPINRFPRIMYSFFSYSLIFFFLFFNYYYWKIVDLQISSLIDITNFFQNLYTLPSQMVINKNFLYRNKLITNEFSTQIDQNQQSDLIYSLLMSYEGEIQSSDETMPQYVIPAVEDINMEFFTMIVEGDICEALFMQDLINEAEENICRSIYNGAFTKGMLAVSNEFANIPNYYMESLLPNNSDLNQIKGFVTNDSVVIDIAAIVFINVAMNNLYDILQVYYKNGMLQQQNNLQLLLILTTVFIGGGFLMVILGYSRYLKRKYRNVSLVLSLIPYDRLMNDEQTVFLIKKYLKN